MTEAMADPKNCIIFLSSKSYEGTELREKEYWYSIPYENAKFSEQ